VTGKSYYVSGNTAEGFINLLSSNVSSFDHTVILQHPSEKLKTAILKDLLKTVGEKECNVEVLLSPLGSDYLDGFIVRDQSVAVVADNLAAKDLSGAVELNLNYFLDRDMPDVREWKEKWYLHRDAAYQNFKEGLTIHDELEKIYIDEMDFARADEIAYALIDKLFQTNLSMKKEQKKIYKRLFGTNTPEGAVNVVPQLTQSVSSVYYLKGRAGTGKSTFMKKIASACEKEGLNIEKYFCSFDPNSLDMVYVPALDFVIFDSTSPHEFFPQREGEEVIDLYEKAVTPGTDEKYKTEIQDATTRYKTKMKKGIEKLREADYFLNEAESEYRFTESEINHISDFIKKHFLNF